MNSTAPNKARSEHTNSPVIGGIAGLMNQGKSFKSHAVDALVLAEEEMKRFGALSPDTLQYIREVGHD